MKNLYPRNFKFIFFKAPFLIFALLLSSLITNAQAPNFAWARQAQGDYSNANETKRYIAADGSGNTYVTGYFQGNITIGNTTLNSSGRSDVFVSKYDAAGNVLWARQGSGSSDEISSGITVDANGNSYVTGFFYGSTTFGTTTLTAGGLGFFLVKYDAAGNVLWAKKGGSSNIQSTGIAVDASGNSYLTGFFYGSTSFGSTTLTSSGSNDVFVAKYDAAGNVLWAKKGGGSDYEHSTGIAVDASGNSYITGHFQNNTIFGSTTLTGSAYYDVFVAKYDAAGNVLWAKKGGGSDYEQSYGIAVDASGNNYITGYFNYNITFGTTTLTAGGSDFFLVKHDAAGNLLWAQKGGSNYEQSAGIAVDASGNSYLTGFFYGSATFGSTTLYSSGSNDVFVAKYDPAGNVLWAKKGGGSSDEQSSNIAIDASGNSYITGHFNGNISFGNTTLNSNRGYNIFVTKYDDDGTEIWALSLDGSTASNNSRAVATDRSGNSYVTGSFRGNITIGNITLTGSGNYDVFVAKYDAAGNVLWAQKSGGSDYKQSTGVAVDASGNSYVTGNFFGNTTFGNITLSGSGNSNFLVKYDAAGNVQWAKKGGGDQSRSIAVDGSGNSYVTGLFYGSKTFGSTTLTSNSGNWDVFVAKYDAAGNVLWAQKGGSSNYVESTGIAVDASGNSYLTGLYFGTTTFGSTTLTNSGSSDVFVAKYDATGNMLWAQKGGGSDYEQSYGIGVDGNGNSYITGYFQSNITFGSTTLTSGGSDIFLIKYDPSGNVIWAQKSGGSYFEQSRGIAVDASGNSYVTGIFNGSSTFGNITLTGSGNYDVFVAKYDASGNVLWAQKGGGWDFEESTSIAVDESGNSYITGNFQNNTTFANSTLNTPGTEVFVAKLNAENYISTLAVTPSVLCSGADVMVTFTTTGPLFGSNNVFTAQLSDASGSFASPITIGILTSSTSGTINTTIPLNTPSGTGYRIRVIGSDPAITGTNNGNDITINSPTAIISGTNTICPGESSNITIALTGVAPWSITYTDGTMPVTVNIATSPFVISVSPATSTSYFLTAVSDANCTSTLVNGMATVTLNTSSNTTANSWTQKANFGGSVRNNAVSFSIGSKGYIGIGGNSQSDLNDFWEFDPSTNVWTQKANFAGLERSFAVGFSINNKGYIGTGSTRYGSAEDFWEYNPLTNVWTQKANFGGGGRYAAIGFSIGNKGYIGTGQGNNGSEKDFWEYDPNTNVWVQKSDCGNSGRYYATGFRIENKGYIGLGYHNGFLDDFWEYDQSTDTWTQKASFAGGPRVSAVGFSIGTKGYLGTGDNHNSLSDFWEFDPASNGWSQKSNFAGGVRSAAISFSVGNRGFIGTGYNGNSLGDFWEYEPGVNITVATVSPSVYCAGSAVSLPFAVDRTLYCDNVFTAQLSNASGSFVSPISIGTLSSTTSGTINATLPSGIVPGTGYRIRVVSSNPAAIGTDNGSNLTINALPTAALSGGGSICPGGSSTLSFALTGSAPWSITYTNGTSPVTVSNILASPYVIAVSPSTSTTYFLTAVSDANCSSTVVSGMAAVTVNTATNAVANSWTQKAGFAGGARGEVVSFSIGTKGYIGTGADDNITPLNDFWEYDPATNVWAQKASFAGGARFGSVGFSIGSKGYIGTGNNRISNLNDFWEYDPATNTWLRKADFGGGARGYAAGFSIGGKGYVGTGNGSTGKQNDFWEYDPTTDTWLQKANFAGVPRDFATGFGIGAKGYIGIGYSTNGALNDFWEYNPTTNAWAQKANFGGAARAEAIGFSIGAKGYMGIGYIAGTYFSDFWEYDPTTNVWTQKANFAGTGVNLATGFSIGSKGYLGTGYDANNSRNDFWEYEPAVNIAVGAISPSAYCAGSTINVPFTVDRALYCSNQFTAQLSDASGNFASPTDIGTLTSSVSGSINTTIPASTVTGTGYRIRVISSSPAATGANNGNNLSINLLQIGSFTPASGPYGTLVTISGSNFNCATAVSFNGTIATFSILNATTIEATVPVGATTGKIEVTGSAGIIYSKSNFRVTVPKPAISSFSPGFGPVGTSVTVSGSGFTGATSLTFNGTPAVFSVANDFTIQTTVPAGATTGKISVTTPGGSASSGGSFTVTSPAVIPLPVVSGFTPAKGPVGTVVTISGNYFSNTSAVGFNGVNAITFQVVNPTTITATVPAGATTGKISVTTPGGTEFSKQKFQVTAGTARLTQQPQNSGETGIGLTCSPNPASGNTVIRYGFGAAGRYSLEVLDLTGARVALLKTADAEAGYQLNYEFNTRGLTSGTYIVRLVSSDGIRITRLLVFR